jgi:Cu(I)/Ag(I) efflux system membrane protein CusA/SilA
VPLGEIAEIRLSPGAPMIRSENAQRTAWVFVDIAGRDLGGYIAEARRIVARDVPLPPGYTLVFSGQFEFWEKTIPRLVAASVLTLVVIVVLLYASSRSWFRVAVVMLAVPFSLVGASGSCTRWTSTSRSRWSSASSRWRVSTPRPAWSCSSTSTTALTDSAPKVA